MACNKTASYTELDITVLLANHLFLPLIAPRVQRLHNYSKYGLITNDSKQKIGSCPCSKRCNAEIVYGNTRFGSGHLWNGRSDIMLYPVVGGNMNIICEYDDMREYQNMIDVTANESQLRNYRLETQVSSSTITFSFFQRKYQSQNLKIHGEKLTSLIPQVIICRHYFDIYLYDTENDVFLRNLGEPMSIFESRPGINKEFFIPKFNLNSVLRLWMLINHLLLHLHLTATQLKELRGTCGIKKEIETKHSMKEVEDSLDTGPSFSKPSRKFSFKYDKVIC